MTTSGACWRRWAVSLLARVLLGLVLLAVVGLRFAEPVADGDLFWQMAYGQQLLERGTLVPDHTLYSWTPASNAPIYCAWVAEIVLYKIGLPGLFVFRYACVLFCLGLALSFLRSTGQLGRWEAFPLLLVLVLSTYLGTMLKPEIFSLVFFNVLAWGYYRWKLTGSQGYLVGLPLLMLVWVNTHGVFVFGLVAIAAMVVAEGFHRKLFLSAGLAFGTVFLTPYGWRYPLYLLQEGRQATPGDQAVYHYVAAHGTIFQALQLHFVEYLVFMGAVAAALAWTSRDRGLIVLNLVFGALYLWYLRTTFYWAPFFFYSSVYALRGRTVPRALQALGLVLFVGWSLRAGYESVYAPYSASWCGFGVSYRNPEVEAEWVRRFHPTPAVYNDYDSGGYLLPRFKVMIDPRSFPYRDWIRNYIEYEGGARFADTVAAGPGRPDVSLVSVKNSALWQNFLRSPDWQLAWFGPSAAIFCRKGHQYPPEAATFAPDRFLEIRNAEKALQVFQLACEAGQWPAAEQLARGVRQNCPADGLIASNMEHFLASYNAFLKGDLKTAIREQEECKRLGRYFSDPFLQRLKAGLVL